MPATLTVLMIRKIVSGGCGFSYVNNNILCSEQLFLDMGKKLVELGFKDVGYELVNIDVSVIIP